MEKFLIFRRYNNLELATEIAATLNNNGVKAQLEDDKLQFDPAYRYNNFDSDIFLKIDPKDFVRARQVLIDFYKPQIEAVDQDYYLFGFDDDELMEIVTKSDEWGEFDYVLAQKILADRGIQITAQEAEALTEERIQQLERPEAATINVAKDFIFGLFFGIYPILSGYDLVNSAKTLPDGRRIYRYTQEERKYGKQVLVYGLVCAIAGIVLFIKFTRSR